MPIPRRPDAAVRALRAACCLAPLWLAPLCLTLVAACAPARAETYFVNATRGNDKGAGTSADQAFRTFARAVRELKPGDALRVASGIYYEQMALNRSGSEDKWISVTGDGPTRPVVKNLEDAIVISGSYVELVGFEAASLGEGSAIAIGKGNHHVRVANNLARDSGCGGIAAQQTDYLVIEDNIARGNSQRSPYQCSGISIYQAKPFDAKPGFHNVIRRNLSYANMNLVVDNKISQSGGKTTDGNGIIIDDFRGTQSKVPGTPYQAATLVENNLVFDNGGRGIHVFLSDNVVVRHNTAYMNLKDKNLSGARNGELSTNKSGHVVFVNNLAVVRDKKQVAFYDTYSTGNSWDANLAIGGERSYVERSDARWGAANVHGVDPKLRAPSVDAATADFHPNPDSPAVGAGLADQAPGDDLEKRSRAAGRRPTVGALEPKGE
jgi:parallel beta-helix repeat protein